MLNEFAVSDLMEDLSKVNSKTGFTSLIKVLEHLLSEIEELRFEMDSLETMIDTRPTGEDAR